MDKFGIMPEQYPVFKLFLKGKDPVNFSGDVTENDLLKFTTKNTGFWFGECNLFLIRCLNSSHFTF